MQISPIQQDDFDKQDIVTLNLERAIQSTIDCAQYIVRQKKLGLPQYSREAFELLEKAGILNFELSIKLQKLVGFRNLVVHSYQNLDVKILNGILANELIVFTEFSRAILSFHNTNKN